MKHELEPTTENFELKAIVEGTPGFRPSMYEYIKDGIIDRRALVKQVKQQAVVFRGR